VDVLLIDVHLISDIETNDIWELLMEIRSNGISGLNLVLFILILNLADYIIGHKDASIQDNSKLLLSYGDFDFYVRLF
jgi:hypothetical protein